MSVWFPSAILSSTAVIVIVCGVFQFADVNVIDDVEIVTWLVERDISTVTSFVGCESNTAV